jgi:hypothetical protein
LKFRIYILEKYLYINVVLQPKFTETENICSLASFAGHYETTGQDGKAETPASTTVGWIPGMVYIHRYVCDMHTYIYISYNICNQRREQEVIGRGLFTSFHGSNLLSS